MIERVISVFSLLRAISLADRGRYAESIVWLNRVEKNVSQRVFLHLLFGAYVSVMSQDFEQASSFLTEFYQRAVDEDGMSQMAHRATPEAVDWVLAFANMVTCVVTGKTSDHFGLSTTNVNLDKIDFGKMRFFYKKMFPPAQIREVERCLP